MKARGQKLTYEDKNICNVLDVEAVRFVVYEACETAPSFARRYNVAPQTGRTSMGKSSKQWPRQLQLDGVRSI